MPTTEVSYDSSRRMGKAGNFLFKKKLLLLLFGCTDSSLQHMGLAAP